MSALNQDGTLNSEPDRISVLVRRRGREGSTIVGVVSKQPRPSLDTVVGELAEPPGQLYDVVMVGDTSISVKI